jgi:hypothetical protein
VSGEHHTSRAARRVVLWLFLASALLYLFTAGANFSGGDSYSELHVTESLVTHGGFDVPILKPGQICAGWGCRGVDGRYYASHAIGYSLFLVPFYVTARAAVAALGAPHCDDWMRCVPIHLISWNTCLVTAATVALLALFAIELGYSIRRSSVLALLYGFASTAWPYARYGFDVTLTGLFLLAAVRSSWLAMQTNSTGSTAARHWMEAGTFGALAVLVRLPSIVAVAPLAVVAFAQIWREDYRQGLRAAGAFALPFVPVLGFSAWYNQTRFGSVLDDGHRLIAANHLSTTPWVGVLGLLLSPGKGIIWYCPLIIVAVYLTPELLQARRSACVIAWAVVVASLVPYALLNDWYGGAAWAPRYFMPVLPLLFLPLLQWCERSRSRTAWLCFAGLTVASVVLQLAGQFVNYADRLSIAATRGYAGAIYWDPRHSPILDHLGTLVTYLMHPGATRMPVPISQSFDVWWLDLWRIDGLDPTLSMVAGAIAGVSCLSAWLKLYTLLRAASPGDNESRLPTSGTAGYPTVR